MNTRTADLVGIFNSALCVVHCLAAPVLVAAGYGMATHPALVLLFVGIAWASVRSAVRHGAKPAARWALFAGLALFAVGAGGELLLAHLDALAYAGSGLLIVGHLLHLSGGPACPATLRAPGMTKGA